MIRGIVLVTMLACVAPGLGQETTGTPATSGGSVSLPFRRILAPSDRKQDWPFRGERYLPIPAAEFNEALKQLPGLNAPPPNAALTEVRLAAEFDGKNNLTGTIEFGFRPTIGEPQLVPLSIFDFALTEARWRQANIPALIGATEHGVVAAWVKAADTMTARWSLRGKSDPAGGVNFDLASFAAPTTLLSLSLPDKYDVQVDGSSLVAETPSKNGSTTYVIRGLSQRRRLRIFPTGDPGSVANPTAVRQDADYEYSERGIDVTAQFRIDAVDEPLFRVEVELDPTLTVVDARFGERRLTWSDVPTGKPTFKRVALEFDPPLYGVGRTVMLRALAPVQVGRRQSLPIVRCPDLDWRQGTMSLSVSSPLVVNRIDTTLCSAATPAPIAGERSGEVIEFTCFDSRATARVIVSRAPDVVEATSVSAVTFGADELTADYRAEMRISAGERFLVQAGVPTRWIVDSVTSVPAGAIADWTLSEVREQKRWLTIRLNQSLRTDRPLRLQIFARAPRPSAGTVLKQEDLRIVEFRDARDDAPAAAVRSSEAWRLELEQERDEGALSADRLDPLRRELLGDFAPEFLVDLRTVAEPWRLRVLRRMARVEARVDVTASLTGKEIEEHYVFHLKNLDNTPLERIQIRFQSGRSGPISWKPADSLRRIEARRLPPGNVIKDETWEVSFVEAPVGEVVFSGVRRSVLGNSNPIVLAAVIDAEAQNGTVSIETDSATHAKIDSTTLAPLAVTGAAERASFVRGRFAYSPLQDVLSDLPPRLTVRCNASLSSPHGIVWKGAVHSRFDVPGRERHTIELLVQSFGAEAFEWRFPQNARRLSVHVDGKPISALVTATNVPIAKQNKLLKVVADYELEVEVAPNPVIQVAEVPQIDVDLPIFQLRRTVELPQNARLLQDALPDGQNTWATRLLRVAGALSSKSMNADGRSRPATGAQALVVEGSILTLRTETLMGIAFVAIVIGVTVSNRVLFGRPKGFWITVAVLAAGAVGLPYSAAQLSIWLLFGVLLGSLCETILPRGVRRSIGPPTFASNDASRSGSAARATTVILLFAAVSANEIAAVAYAQTLDSEPVPAVFVPVDDAGRETGERYLVPERFWREIESRRTAQSTDHNALILSAEYSLILAHDARRANYFVSQVAAKWQVEALRAGASISLPFNPFNESTFAVVVDGRPVEVARSADGDKIIVVLESAGSHQVEAIARAGLNDGGSASQFDLLIPQVLDNTVRIVAPPELNGLSVLEAIDAPTRSEDRRTTTFRTAKGGSLHLTWESSATSAARAEFEQYEYWRIRPGLVTVDVKLRLISKSSAGRELTLYGDPRLQWLARRNGEEKAVVVTASPVVVDQATIGQRLRWTASDDLEPDATLEASFVLSGAGGIGRMRLPELRIEDAPAKRRIFAVSVDPALEHAFHGSKGIAPLAIPEFERAWGVLSPLPQAAFEYLGAGDDFSLSLRPTPAKLDATSTQTLICGTKRIEVVYDALLTATGDGVAYHEIQVPAAIDVETVSIVDADGEEQLLRWSRDDVGSVIAFVRSSVQGEHRLNLRGRLAVPASRQLPLPIVTIPASSGVKRIRIARLPDAVASVSKVKQLAAIPLEGAGETDGRGRIDTVLEVAGAKPSAELQVRDNIRLVDAQVMSSLRRDAAKWELELVARLNVRSGLLDEIHLDLPPTIATPLTVSPAMPYEVSTLHDGRRRLVLHPRDAIRGEFQFALRSPLTALDREHPVPHVRFRQVESAEYYFQLPAQSGVNRVDWELQQLVAAESPNGFAKPTTEEVLTFRAAGPRPSAVLRDVRRTGERPQVRLADYRVRATSQGEHGVATFLVEPSGLSDYRLLFPQGITPLAVRAGGLNVSLDGGTELVVTAPTSRLPHFVEVLFQRPAMQAEEFDLRILRVPTLPDLPVVRTLWTIEADRNLRLGNFENSGHSNELRVAQSRLESLDGVAAELGVDGGLGVAGDWVIPISIRRRQAQVDVDRLTAASPPEKGISPRPSTVGKVAASVAADEKRLTTDERLSFDELWAQERNREATHVYLASANSLEEARLRPESTIAASAASRLIAPGLCVLLAVAGYYCGRNDGLFRWAPFTCALLGVGWLALLQPPAVGWILLATAVVCRLHSSLRSARNQRLMAPVPLRLAR